MRSLLSFITLVCCVATAASVPYVSSLINSGRFAEAAKVYLEKSEHAETPVDQLKARLNAASCMKISGDISAATRLLADSTPLLDSINGDQVQAVFMSEYGSILALGRKPALAVPVLKRAAELAAKLDDRSLLAEVLNDQGIAFASAGKPEDAYASCESAMKLASVTGNPDLLARARQNRLLAAYAIWKREFDALSRHMDTNPLTASDSALKASRTRFEVSLSESILHTSGSDPTPSLLFESVTAGVAAVRYGLEEKGFRALEGALEQSRATGRREIERASMMALTELYIEHSRHDDAKKLLTSLRELSPEENALQLATMETLAARCEMLPGGDSKRAFAHVEKAIREVEDMRGDLATTQSISDLGRTFRESAGQPYLILADLETRDGSPAALIRAQQAVEAYKAWELDDFYRDDCVNLALAGTTDLSSQIPKDTAVLYVIPLTDRTELLVGTSNGTRKWTSSVSADALNSKVRLLRYQLEYERGLPSYLPTSEFLYETMIAPFLEHLRSSGIKHLVFVPEGPFATVPLAALRNPTSNRFLIEDFSISVSPGLMLLPNDASAKGEQTILLAGVSMGVQGFPPLPEVNRELTKIAKVRNVGKVLLNSAFTSGSLTNDLAINQATTIHLASHAEFSGDADETFLLTYDGRITMNELERMIRPRKFTGKPVDLLCLSACRTAAGDERAALGLAGAAIKSGARTVVASLWYVDDAASSALMLGFHRRLEAGLTGKSEALRQAQLDMIRSDPYIHPYLWAPFILIGDWK